MAGELERDLEEPNPAWRPKVGLHRKVLVRAARGTAIPKGPEAAYAPEPAAFAEFTEAEGQHAIG